MAKKDDLCESNQPQSAAQAEEMILQLQDEIDEIQNQLNDPRIRNQKSVEEYESWRYKALAALRYRKGTVRRLAHWKSRQNIGIVGSCVALDHVAVTQAMRLAAKQYSRLAEVALAADEYVNSQSGEGDDQRLWDALYDALERLKQVVILRTSE
jgi:hypothetical protein